MSLYIGKREVVFLISIAALAALFGDWASYEFGSKGPAATQPTTSSTTSTSAPASSPSSLPVAAPPTTKPPHTKTSVTTPVTTTTLTPMHRVETHRVQTSNGTTTTTGTTTTKPRSTTTTTTAKKKKSGSTTTTSSTTSTQPSTATTGTTTTTTQPRSTTTTTKPPTSTTTTTRPPASTTTTTRPPTTTTSTTTTTQAPTTTTSSTRQRQRQRQRQRHFRHRHHQRHDAYVSACEQHFSTPRSNVTDDRREVARGDAIGARAKRGPDRRWLNSLFNVHSTPGHSLGVPVTTFLRYASSELGSEGGLEPHRRCGHQPLKLRENIFVEVPRLSLQVMSVERSVARLNAPKSAVLLFSKRLATDSLMSRYHDLTTRKSPLWDRSWDRGRHNRNIFDIEEHHLRSVV